MEPGCWVGTSLCVVCATRGRHPGHQVVVVGAVDFVVVDVGRFVEMCK